MLPQDLKDFTNSSQAATRGVAALISESRSEYRKGFCANVVAKAIPILNEIEQDPGWKCIFNQGEDQGQGNDEVKRSLDCVRGHAQQ